MSFGLLDCMSCGLQMEHPPVLCRPSLRPSLRYGLGRLGSPACTVADDPDLWVPELRFRWHSTPISPSSLPNRATGPGNGLLQTKSGGSPTFHDTPGCCSTRRLVDMRCCKRSLGLICTFAYARVAVAPGRRTGYCLQMALERAVRKLAPITIEHGHAAYRSHCTSCGRTRARMTILDYTRPIAYTWKRWSFLPEGCLVFCSRGFNYFILLSDTQCARA